MLLPKGMFVGVNPASGRRPVSYAALDRDLRVVALDQGEIEQVLAFIGGAETSVVGVNAPQSLSKGLLQKTEIRVQFNLPADGRGWREGRGFCIMKGSGTNSGPNLAERERKDKRRGA